jgi:hypothetical protein
VKTFLTHGSSSKQSVTLSPEERDEQGLEQWRKEQRMLFNRGPKYYDKSRSASVGETSHVPSHVSTKDSREAPTSDATCQATGHGGESTPDFGHERYVGVSPVGCTDTNHASAASTSKPL